MQEVVSANTQNSAVNFTSVSFKKKKKKVTDTEEINSVRQDIGEPRQKNEPERK